MKRTVTFLAVGLVGLGTLAACSPSSTDFKTEGEKFIEKDDGDVATELGYTFSDASCEKPSDTDTGTTYACTAVDEAGDNWDFTVEITGKRELTVQGAYAPKLLREQLLDAVGGTANVDPDCVDGVIASYDEDEVKEAFLDTASATPSDATTELFTDMGQQIASACLS